MKKATAKKTGRAGRPKKESTKTEEIPKNDNPIVAEIDLEEVVQKELFPEEFSEVENGEVFVPDFEGVDSVAERVEEHLDENLKASQGAFDKFIDIYSPPVVTRENARLEKVGERYVIKVKCPTNAQNSMPKFIDQIAVEFE